VYPESQIFLQGMRNFLLLLVSNSVILSLLVAPALGQSPQARARWSTEQANSWYSRQPWLVGSNFTPADAINQLEMWQADTFDPSEIDKELGWAQSVGMNTMRVFLHDLLWQQDSKGLQSRIDQFLTIAAKHHIKPLFVLFDSCWDPRPHLGLQHPPIPGIHNSGWVQSPGQALSDSSQYPRLQAYVVGVTGAFAQDDRILGWDLWNEPSNSGGGAYDRWEPKDKEALVQRLIPQVFAWARSANPSQPLTSGLFESGNWSLHDDLSPTERTQVDESDIISFHSYSWPEEFERRILWLQSYHRPIICTEYMARGIGSTFDNTLPIAKKYNVGAINWGLVAGKTQTYLPWDSWQHPYIGEDPPVWFHDVFSADGKPYREREVEILRELTGAARSQ
jgi:Cellulase (glycosyl hydrolase family 5)